MASQPIMIQLKGQTVYRVRWRFEGKWQDVDELTKVEAQRASDWITERSNKISGNDPLVRGHAWLVGELAAREAVSEVPTLGEIFAEMLTDKAYNTKRTWQATYRNHLGELRNMPVNKIDATELNAHWRSLRAKVPALSTAVGHMCRISGAVRHAWGLKHTEFDLIRARAAGALKYPSTTKQQNLRRYGLSMPAFDALRAAMPSDRDRLITFVMAATGARICEVLALHIEDIDFERGLLHIGHHLVNTTRLVGTKATKGQEVLEQAARVLPTGLLAELRVYVGDRTGVLFTRTTGRIYGPYITPNWWRKNVFKPTAKPLISRGILPAKVSPHWLRHTTATRLTPLVGPMMSKHQMGHADISQTVHYTAVDDAIVLAIRSAWDGLEAGLAHAA
jgi:integrase